MSELKQATQALDARSKECIDNGAPVTIEIMYPGDMFAQGDVGILMLEKLPKSAKKIDTPANRQVAPGNTQGSRHCVDANDKVEFYSVNDGDQLSDLCVTAPEGFTLRHPEHGDVTVPGGIYRYIHQQNELRQRVLD